MTEADLAAIEARAEAATEGPWTGFPSGILRGPAWVVRNLPEGERGRIMSDEDAAFIASARSDVPALVAEVRRLKADLEAKPSAKDMSDLRKDSATLVDVGSIVSRHSRGDLSADRALREIALAVGIYPEAWDAAMERLRKPRS